MNVSQFLTMPLILEQSMLQDLLCGVPGMGDSLAVKVRYGLGSGNH
jgi:hypothetical protein